MIKIAFTTRKCCLKAPRSSGRSWSGCSTCWTASANRWSRRKCPSSTRPKSYVSSTVKNDFPRAHYTYFMWGRCIERVASIQFRHSSAVVIYAFLFHVLLAFCPSIHPCFGLLLFLVPCRPTCKAITLSPQPFFLHFPLYFFHFRHPSYSFIFCILSSCVKTILLLYTKA